MRFKALKAAALLALFCAASPAQDTQQNDQKVIEDFVGSRGISFDAPDAKPTSTNRVKPRPTPRTSRQSTGSKNSTATTKKPGAKAGTNSTTAQGKTQPPVESDGGGAAGDEAAGDGSASTVTGGASVVKASLRPIGLGYTLFLKDPAGGLTPVDPTREFKTGESVAVALETNTDGYLYIFSAENDRNPELVFPHVLLDGGENKIGAHVRETVPADVNYGIEFQGDPVTEYLYIIVSRQPLAGVPTGAALARHCGAEREGCKWTPTPEQWEKITRGAPGSRVREGRDTMLLTQLQKPVEPESLTRALRIKKVEPKPAIVRLNDSPATNVLVTTIKLVHK